ncbi:MAG: hypothetical protein OK456_10975 [Thaumarchaeota archaeon]|nr:hypothetical protein [Nitrososphaerota archaeon]
MARMAEKIPSWVERLLIPTLESKVRTIVSEEVGHLEKVLDARFDGVHSEIRRVDEKIGSLEKRFPEVQEIAEIKARLSQVESKVSSR